MKRRIFPWVLKSIPKYFVYKEERSLPLVVPPTCPPSLPAWWLLVATSSFCNSSGGVWETAWWRGKGRMPIRPSVQVLRVPPHTTAVIL